MDIIIQMQKKTTQVKPSTRNHNSNFTTSTKPKGKKHNLQEHSTLKIEDR
jgi:hypothetical protein